MIIHALKTDNVETILTLCSPYPRDADKVGFSADYHDVDCQVCLKIIEANTK